MPVNFPDASAVVTLARQQPSLGRGTGKSSSKTRQWSVWLDTRTECVSALMRQVREGNLTPSEERAARQVLYALVQAWIEIQPGAALRSTAERLLVVHPLRTADAFQLAAAILWRRELPAEQSFRVAQTLGCVMSAIEKASPFFPTYSDGIRRTYCNGCNSTSWDIVQLVIPPSP